VFKLSAEALRAAGGQVRCGRCGEVFNALQRLAEDASGFAGGESPLELEARADSILESVVIRQADAAVPHDKPSPDEQELDELTPHESGPPGVEIARLEILDLNEDENADDPPPHPESVLADESMHARGFEVPEAVRREMLAGIDQAARSERSALEADAPGAERRSAARRNAERRDAERRINERRRADRRPFMLWLCGAIVTGLLLLVQLVHFNREWIMAHGPFGDSLRALYAALGSGAPAANLSLYQLRQWGVTGDPGANGTLRVRASILNAAPEPAPYPLLRVTLANRFGNRIGSRDFEPAEYLGKPVAGLLGAGVRVDATLEILDPGKDAEGFEIDVCLRQPDQRISCAGDAAAQMNK